MKKLLTVFWLGFLFSGILKCQDYKIANRFHIPGDNGWDYLTVDEPTGRIFVSHGIEVNVINTKDGKLLGTIPDTKGVHGIAIAQDLNKAFISNGRDSSVSVINLGSLNLIEKVRVTGQNPDAILYDPFSHHVFAWNGRTSNATVIDGKTNKVVATIPLDGKPEFSVTDGNGKIYVNIEDKSEISLISSSSNKVEKTWSISPGEEPTGLALDNENHRLFSVCSNKLMIIMDALSGKVITSLPIGARCDGAAFDPQLKRAYSSNGEGTITVVQEEGPDKFRVIETVKTIAGARTIALDKKTHHLYLPCAEYESTGKEGKPSIKPGSFMVLDVQPSEKSH